MMVVQEGRTADGTVPACIIGAYASYTMDWLGGAVAERSAGMQQLAGLSFLRPTASRHPSNPKRADYFFSQ